MKEMIPFQPAAPGQVRVCIQGAQEKKEADTRESSTRTALPKAFPAASLLHSPIPLWRGNLLHLTPLHSVMPHHGQLSSYSSSGVCCHYLLLPYDFIFPNRAIHSVEIYFKEFRGYSLHFQILKDGNCFTFARLISYQKHLADKRQKTDRQVNKIQRTRKMCLLVQLILKKKKSFRTQPG